MKSLVNPLKCEKMNLKHFWSKMAPDHMIVSVNLVTLIETNLTYKLNTIKIQKRLIVKLQL